MCSGALDLRHGADFSVLLLTFFLLHLSTKFKLTDSQEYQGEGSQILKETEEQTE